MREPDREQFKEAMKKEVEAHTKNEMWELIKKLTVPKDHKIMPSVWEMKRKRGMWNKHLIKRLKKVEFGASQIDESLFYKGQSVFVLYTEDSILAGPDSKELDSIIEEMKKAELDLTVEGDIADFLGVKIERSQDGKSFSLTQPHLIDDILKELRWEADKTAVKRQQELQASHC